MKRLLPALLLAMVSIGSLVGLALTLLPQEMAAEEAVTAVAREQPAKVAVTQQSTPLYTPPPTPVRQTRQPTAEDPEEQAPSAGEAVRPPRPTPEAVEELPPTADPVIDTTESGNAVVKVRMNTDRKVTVRIEHGEDKYDHILFGDGMFNRYPLNMGTGKYRLLVYEQVRGDAYRPVGEASFSAVWEDPNTPYLQSVQRLHWSPEMDPIYDAAWLAQTAEPGQGTQAVFDDLAYSLQYDDSLLNKLPDWYIADIEKTYATKKGICYDFSTLFASMLRSTGVPAKLVVGTSSLIDGKHAWNEVWIGGKWVVVDLTVNAIYNEAGREVTFAQDSAQYYGARAY